MLLWVRLTQTLSKGRRLLINIKGIQWLNLPSTIARWKGRDRSIEMLLFSKICEGASVLQHKMPHSIFIFRHEINRLWIAISSLFSILANLLPFYRVDVHSCPTKYTFGFKYILMIPLHKDFYVEHASVSPSYFSNIEVPQQFSPSITVISPVHLGVVSSLQVPLEHVAELVPLSAKPRSQL